MVHVLRSPAAPLSNRWPCILVQQIAERLIGKLLKRLPRLAREQVERVPRLRIKLDQLSSALCRLLGHYAPHVACGMLMCSVWGVTDDEFKGVQRASG